MRRSMWGLTIIVAFLLPVALVAACGAARGKPSVKITSPPDNSQVTEGSEVIVQAGALGGGMIESVELSVDGVYHSSATNPHISVAFQAELKWQASGVGSHALEVVAYNSDGQASDPASITIEVVK